MQRSTTRTIFMSAIALTAWFGLIVQYLLKTGPSVNFFSFFTVQTNLLIALALTISLIAPSSLAGRMTNSVSFQTAIGLYIFVVAVVYNTVLRGLVKLEGMGLLVDTILHVIVPALYLMYWAIFVSKSRLHWKDGLSWLLFPFLYLLYSMLRGAVIGWYPYPFLNPARQGYPQVLVNVILVIAVFLLGGLLMIAITRAAKNTQESIVRK